MNKPVKIDDYLTPHDLAVRWKHAIGVQTLANWRSAGTGPAFLKIGGRVMYRRLDVEEWEAAQLRAPAKR